MFLAARVCSALQVAIEEVLVAVLTAQWEYVLIWRPVDSNLRQYSPDLKASVSAVPVEHKQAGGK